MNIEVGNSETIDYKIVFSLNQEQRAFLSGMKNVPKDRFQRNLTLMNNRFPCIPQIRRDEQSESPGDDFLLAEGIARW